VASWQKVPKFDFQSSFDYSWFLAKKLSKFSIPFLKTPQPVLP
jgi:hypothetical protein